MEKKIVIFSGSKQDQYGMPTPFHFYGVFASPYEKDNQYAVVIKVGVSQDVPGDTQETKLIQARSEKEALEAVIKELKEHPKNKGLRFEISDIPDIKL